MNEEEVKEDAKNHYCMELWLDGESDAKSGVMHIDGSPSYNAGYNFGIWKQEQASGVHG